MTTPKEALELKPCPFCGSRDVEAVDSLDFVACQNCGASLEDSEPSARELWNTRATAPLQGEDAVERVARIIDPSAWRDHGYKHAKWRIQQSLIKARAILATGLVLDKQEKWRHKNRGTTYTIIDSHTLVQCEKPLTDNETVLLYRDTESGKWAVRRSNEFHDGRFERVK